MAYALNQNNFKINPPSNGSDYATILYLHN